MKGMRMDKQRMCPHDVGQRHTVLPLRGTTYQPRMLVYPLDTLISRDQQNHVRNTAAGICFGWQHPCLATTQDCI